MTPQVAGTKREPGATWAILAVALFLLLHLPGLTRVPAFGGDEVRYGEAGYALWRTGRMAIPIWGTSQHFDTAFFVNVPGLPLALSAVYSIFGLGLWQTRLPALVTAVGCIVMVMALARSAGCRRPAAALGGTLCGLAPWFGHMARNGRPDTLAIAFTLGGLWVVIQRRRSSGGKPWHAVVAGTLMGCGLMVHPNVLPVTLATLLLGVVARGGRVAYAGRFVVGLLMPVGPWLLLAALNWPAFHDQFLTWSRMNTTLGENPAVNLYREVVGRHGQGYAHGVMWLPLTAMSLALALAGWFVGNVAVKALLTVWFVQFGLFALARSKESDMLVYWEPYVAVLGAAVGQELWRRRADGDIARIRWMIGAVIFSLALVNGFALMGARYWLVATQWTAQGLRSGRTRVDVVARFRCESPRAPDDLAARQAQWVGSTGPHPGRAALQDSRQGVASARSS